MPRWWTLIGLVAGIASAHAATVGYPGAPPCDTTLQACVDGVADGTRIEIVTAGPIDQGANITKSITLTGAAGVRPVIGASGTTRQVRINDAPNAPVSVVLQGLTLSNANVRIRTFSSAGPDQVEIADCGITNTSGGAAISIEPAVPGSIAIHDNDLASAGYIVDSLMSQPSGDLAVTLARNRITASAPGFSGINLDIRGGGATTVEVEDNVVHDVAGGAITIDTLESVRATVRIVNDTIDRAGMGLQVTLPGGTSTLDLALFNTIIAQATGRGVEIGGASPSLTVTGGFNDLFANAVADQTMGYSLGPAFAVDPLFADGPGADYHLKPGSLLIDAGSVSPPGGLPALDADGNVRVAGKSVDVGAFEFGAMPPTTTTTTTTTLPGCAATATFASVDCRLGELRAHVAQNVPAGRVASRLAALVDAATRAEQAAAASARPRVRRRKLAQAVHALVRVDKVLSSKGARGLDPTVRSSLRGEADGVRTDLATLRVR